MSGRCICGCQQPGPHGHHAITQQELRRIAGKRDKRRARGLTRDERNIVPVTFGCHSAHHSGSKLLALCSLPDSVFEFAIDVMGHGRAYNYLRRHYDGEDPRLDALLESAAC